YTGKIIGYGMRKTIDGALSPTIKFQTVDQDGRTAFVFWQKSLATAKSTDFALKELILCGLRDIESFQYLADGPESNVLDMEQQLNLTVEHKEKNGKFVPFVAWVNTLRDPNAKDEFAISREETERLLETVDLSNA